MSDKYISIKQSVSGYSFANLGFFWGLASNIYSAVFSLIMLEIFNGNAASVGVYSAVSSAVWLACALVSGEFFRYFAKAKLLYISLIAGVVMAFAIGFQVQPATFMAVDLASNLPWILISMCIPLMLLDFAKGPGIEKLNARYHTWLNVGALFSPVIAFKIANLFGYRANMFLVAACILVVFIQFAAARVNVADKPLPKRINPRKTLRAIWRDIVIYFRRPAMIKAYASDFGYYALQQMRKLYVPIIVIQEGFSKDMLGWVLAIGIIPYIMLSDLVGHWAKRYGKRGWMIAGFWSFAVFSFMAMFVSGWWLLGVFVVWQFSGALMEPLHDLIFFDAASKSEQTRFYGIFQTAGSISKVVVPMLGAAAITVFGGTSVVWLTTGIVGILTGLMLLRK